jgi:hypothetical protein
MNTRASYQLYRSLRHNSKLSERRNPMFERNRFAKGMIYFMMAFWAVYLILIGIGLTPMFRDIRPGMEPYHLFNGGMVFLLAIDFWLRFMMQQTPSQEIKSYALLPIKRNFLLNTFLVQRMLDTYNLFWFFLLVPFACMAMFTKLGVMAIIGFLLGWWLLIVMNSQFYLFCRTLINHKMVWLVLPLAFYGLLAGLFFGVDHPSFYRLCMDWGEGFFLFNPLSYLIVLAFIAVLFVANRRLSAVMVYGELSKVEQVKLKHVSEFTFLERFGQIGEYLKLEMKCSMRCSMVKKRFITGILLIVMFCGMLTFSEAYDSYFMKNFICIYCYAVLGMMTLTQVMGFEGNYIDGLMSRKESILSLLKAKYYFNCIVMILPFLLILPAIFAGKVTWLMSVTFAFLTTGPIYFTFFQLAPYNKQTIPLNNKFISKGNMNNRTQTLVSLGTFFLPLLLVKLLQLALGPTWGLVVLLAIGIGFTVTNGIWMRGAYRRFMKHRYGNMEGFRATRERL